MSKIQEPIQYPQYPRTIVNLVDELVDQGSRRDPAIYWASRLYMFKNAQGLSLRDIPGGPKWQDDILWRLKHAYERDEIEDIKDREELYQVARNIFFILFPAKVAISWFTAYTDKCFRYMGVEPEDMGLAGDAFMIRCYTRWNYEYATLIVDALLVEIDRQNDILEDGILRKKTVTFSSFGTKSELEQHSLSHPNITNGE